MKVLDLLLSLEEERLQEMNECNLPRMLKFMCSKIYVVCWKGKNSCSFVVKVVTKLSSLQSRFTP